MQGLILAAGMGIRIKEYTAENTKCMIEVNGERLIKRAIEALNKIGISKIIIVCGYKKENLKKYVEENFKDNEIIFVENNEYKITNNIYSLFLARNYLIEDNTILLESDLIFEDTIIKKLVEDNNKSIVAVSKYKNGMDGTVVTLDENNMIKKFYEKKEFNINNVDNYYKTINIYKLDKEFCITNYIPYLEKYIGENKKNEFYEVIFKNLIDIKNIKIKAKVFETEKWYEIDNVQDLDIAKCLFSNELKNYQNRYGGYWRFNKLKDFCYLQNPKFPPKEMFKKINYFSEELIKRISF